MTQQTGQVSQRSILAIALFAILTGAIIVASPVIAEPLLIAALTIGAFAFAALEITSPHQGLAARLAPPLALTWLVIGAAIALWPGHNLRTIAILAGVGLILTGVLHVLVAARYPPRRLVPILLGSSLLIAGAATVAWSNLTTLVVALIVGLTLAARGFTALIGRHQHPAHDPSRSPGLMPALGAALVLVVTIALLGSAFWLNQTHPTVGSFYDPPKDASTTPGTLLRSEPFTEGIPDGARAWKILYATTIDDDTPAFASGIVVAPASASSTPAPLVAWAHGTTGFAQGCAPSNLPTSFETGAMFVVDKVVGQGWVMVSTDYIGLGAPGIHPYLIGEQEGRSVLDSARAARQLTELSLSDQTVVWGHSQGGHAALWTGQIAATYAPDVNVIAVAALAPASNLSGLVENLQVMKGGELFAAYVAAAYAGIYPDVHMEHYITPSGRIAMTEFASRCLAEREIMLSILTLPVLPGSIWKTDPTEGPLAARLAENIPSGPINVPLFIGQGAADELVIPAMQQDYAATRCQQGDTVDFRLYEGRGHVEVVEADSALIPDLIAWTTDRFTGTPATTTC